MEIQFDLRYITSFALFMQHEILDKGKAFTNYSGLLYPTVSKVTGQTRYSAPFKSLVNDSSISNANIITGVYVNGNFLTIGQSGLSYINHSQGSVHFTGNIPNNTVISGNYAVSDFSILISDQYEYKILFETKFVTNSKFNEALTGYNSDIKTIPAIFLRPKVQENKGFAFGRLDDNALKIRATIVTDSEYSKIGVCNILKNLNYRTFSIISGLPFDNFGNYTGLDYNYNNLTFASGYQATIMKAKAIDVPLVGEFANISKNIAFVDFDISVIMRHP